MASKNTYQPDYAVSPGSVLEERLAAHEISHAEFARRCGRSAKLVSEIISGNAPVEPETALQFEKVLGVDASIWLGIEADYQLHGAREAQKKELERAVAWQRKFPLREIVKRGCFPRPANDTDGVSKLLAFFGVASADAWRGRFGATSVAYRRAAAFHSTDESLATWLRFGELEAAKIECADFDEARFRSALREIRAMTAGFTAESLPDMRDRCKAAGVAFVVVRELPGMAVSGAARWLSPRKATIQLSFRYLSDDHFWFSFFHEAAHLLLHSKKDVFVDAHGGDQSNIEEEANAWAENVLVSRHRWQEFVDTNPSSEAEIRAFASEQGIAPGIVVGRLQHEGIIPWRRFNHLKRRYMWIVQDG